MAPIGRAGLLQLLRGTSKPRQPSGVPTTIAGTVVAQTASPEPTASVLVDPHACARGSLASATACAPSLSRRSLCRQSSEIRTGCANERPSGSIRGVSRTVISLPGSQNPLGPNCAGNRYFTVNGADAVTFSHSISSCPFALAPDSVILRVSTGDDGLPIVRGARPSSVTGSLV